MNRALFGIRGFLIDAPRMGTLRSRSDGAIIIDDGMIAEVGEYDSLRKKPRAETIRWLQSKNVAVFPGLIDLHTHLPQYPAVARGQSELLPWLRQHIFPLEKEFTGAKARREASSFFHQLARHGTTTAMIYTTIYEESCEAAFDAAAKSGMRILMGKMMMDVDSYGSLQPSQIAPTSLKESERLCKKWHGKNDGLLDYVFSPRFAVTCSEELMRGAASLAKQYSAFVQTHLAENHAEIETVRQRFPKASDYTDIYDQCGLLSEKSVFGHCIHLSERELDRLHSSNSSVAHCPTSNLFLSSGIMPLDHILNHGIRVGLGSDVAAGPELNLWQVMRSTIESQKARSFYAKDVRVPTPADAFFLATQGAAEALGKRATIGSFEIGKEADLTVIDLSAILPYPRDPKATDDLTAEDVLSLCVYRAGPHATAETFVRGRSVYRAAEPQLL